MAEVLRRAGKSPAAIERLAFIVLAPEYSIKAGLLAAQIDIERMRQKIRARVSAYDGQFDEWYEKWAEPTLASSSIYEVSWEQAIGDLFQERPEAANSLQEFYGLCLKFN